MQIYGKELGGVSIYKYIWQTEVIIVEKGVQRTAWYQLSQIEGTVLKISGFFFLWFGGKRGKKKKGDYASEEFEQ